MIFLQVFSQIFSEFLLRRRRNIFILPQMKRRRRTIFKFCFGRKIRTKLSKCLKLGKFAKSITLDILASGAKIVRLIYCVICHQKKLKNLLCDLAPKRTGTWRHWALGCRIRGGGEKGRREGGEVCTKI